MCCPIWDKTSIHSNRPTPCRRGCPPVRGSKLGTSLQRTCFFLGLLVLGVRYLVSLLSSLPPFHLTLMLPPASYTPSFPFLPFSLLPFHNSSCNIAKKICPRYQNLGKCYDRKCTQNLIWLFKERTEDSISYNNLLLFYWLYVFRTLLTSSEEGGEMKTNQQAKKKKKK